ncbi:DNA replication/repair protein RecF [Sphingosinicella sp.]|uniref:DNA replication/repair protein RecF n=1 Tax=Sphingosinicella sp. TaxID=1917971 RepID=UPI0035AF8221
MPTQPRTIDRLRLTDFRSYAHADITAGAGAVVLTGDNGAGKTNLLEAISLLAPGRGLRRAGLPEMGRISGSGGFAVAATLGCGADASVEIGTGTQAEAPGRRLVRVNGAGAAANALSEWLSVLWLTPAMDRLFLESAGGRRRFLDRLTLALVPQHAGHTQRYDAAMQSRNRLLGGERAPDADWLASLEKQMAEHGAAVDAARRMAIAALGQEIAASDTGPFPKGALLLEGEAWEAEALAEALAASRRTDMMAGRTTVGPHRSDLAVTHLAKDQPAARASTGEQKALLLGLVLAHARVVAARTGRRPVLLLDEVAAHLDETRRAALFAMLEADAMQVWMTGTDVSLFRAIGADATYIDVSNGRLSRL